MNIEPGKVVLDLRLYLNLLARMFTVYLLLKQSFFNPYDRATHHFIFANLKSQRLPVLVGGPGGNAHLDTISAIKSCRHVSN